MSNPKAINLTITERAQAARDALKEHDTKRKILEADLAYVQAICPHANTESWLHDDYGGGCDRHWLCNDCGLHKVT